MADSALTALMQQTISVAKFKRLDQYGDAVYDLDNPQSVQCRVSYRPQMIRDGDGREVVSSAQVWTSGNTGITVQDKVTLPDGSSPILLRVDSPPDETGQIYHQKLYV